MPQCAVRLYRERDGRVPFHDWLLSLIRPSKRQNLNEVGDTEIASRYAFTKAAPTAERRHGRDR